MAALGEKTATGPGTSKRQRATDTGIRDVGNNDGQRNAIILIFEAKCGLTTNGVHRLERTQITNTPSSLTFTTCCEICHHSSPFSSSTNPGASPQPFYRDVDERFVSAPLSSPLAPPPPPPPTSEYGQNHFQEQLRWGYSGVAKSSGNRRE